MVKKIFLILIVLPVISISLVLITPLVIPVNIETEEEFQEAKFGLPFPFIQQNLLLSGAGGYEGSFPHRFDLQMDFLDYDPQLIFLKMNFIYSITVIYFFLLTNYFVATRFFSKERKFL